MMDISTPYYSDLSRISNSNIGWFLNKGPAYLHKMLTDPPPEEKNAVLERGTMIHEYLLQPEEFNKDYVIWDKPKPSSTQQEKFCQALVNSLEIEPNKALLSAFKDTYSTSGKSEEKMLTEALKIASTLKEYIDFIKSGDKRKMISIWDFKMLDKIKHNVANHKLANKLLEDPVLITSEPFLDEPKQGTIEKMVAHEFHINWEYETINQGTIKCKSLLDSLTIDFTNKTITIMDLKTTAKLWHFEDSMTEYDYCRQLMYYTMAVEWYMLNEQNIDVKNEHWIFKYYIIGIDTISDNAIRVFEVLLEQVQTRERTIIKALNDIAWHMNRDHNIWEHSRAYYEGDGSERLNI